MGEIAYKLCILAAGRGTRMGDLTSTLNKALLPIDGKACISHVIDSAAGTPSIVVAIGYEGEKVREYLEHAHPDRAFEFVTVTNFDGPGSGPAHSLLCCSARLQQPFTVCAADTLYPESTLPDPVSNWIAVDSVDDCWRYCAVERDILMVPGVGDVAFVAGFQNKCLTGPGLAFTGAFGVGDWYRFWREARAVNTVTGEFELAHIMERMMGDSRFRVLPLAGWTDVGTLDCYRRIRMSVEGMGPTGFLFDKPDEWTYSVNDRIVKYNADPKKTRNKIVRRLITSLLHATPFVDRHGTWFFSYPRIEGTVLYDRLCYVPDFFEWIKHERLLFCGTPSRVSSVSKTEFTDACMKFYRDKTLARLATFADAHPGVIDAHYIVNGFEVAPVSELIKSVPWDELVSGARQSAMHGDLQFDNVLMTSDDTFVLLDWRDTFGGLVEVGDAYYDVAKMLGGLTISYRSIKRGEFSYSKLENDVTVHLPCIESMRSTREACEQFITEQGYALDRVRMLRALIFLNMSPLHPRPFGELLFYFGALLLQQSLEGCDVL